MKYWFKILSTFLTALFISVNIQAQTSKSVVQTISFDDNIQYIQIKSDTLKKTYTPILWKGNYVLIECTLSVDSDKSAELPASIDCKVSTVQQKDTLIIDLESVPDGTLFIGGEQFKLNASYRILIPDEMVLVNN